MNLIAANTKMILGDWIKNGDDTITIQPDGKFLRNGNPRGTWVWESKGEEKKFERSVTAGLPPTR